MSDNILQTLCIKCSKLYIDTSIHDEKLYHCSHKDNTLELCPYITELAVKLSIGKQNE